MKKTVKSTPRSPEKSLSEEEEPPPLIDAKGVVVEHCSVRNFISAADFNKVVAIYPFVATEHYLSLAGQEPNDPIMRQLCPSVEELIDVDGLSEDPLAEEQTSPMPGLVHRYTDRVLLIVTNCCFMNCRHCTRKRLWKKHRFTRTLQEIGRMIDYIKEHKEVRDVIISGGDPLTLPDGQLEVMLERLRRLKHVEMIRIGTRAPVVKPDRINAWLAAILKRYSPLWINTQFNHPREITPQAGEAVKLLREAGAVINNQSVLLKGINDDPVIMKQLCHGLLRIGVRPYYLFHCDPVAGVAHFRTTITKGLEIIEQLRGHTSGLAVPTYVVDAVRGGGKIPLQPDYALLQQGGLIVLRNYRNECFTYNDAPELRVQ